MIWHRQSYWSSKLDSRKEDSVWMGYSLKHSYEKNKTELGWHLLFVDYEKAFNYILKGKL
jgi:hypothetical protein